MFRQQQGMTLIGLLIMAVVAGALIFAAMRLVPVYLEHMKIVSALESLKTEHDGNNSSVAQLRVSIEKRLDTEDVKSVNKADFKITNVSGGRRVAITYENTVPYVANVYLTVKFDNAVEILN